MFKDYADQGRLLTKCYGEYEIFSDTIKIRRFRIKEYDSNGYSPVTFVFNNKSLDKLIDIENNNVYNRTNK